MFYESLEHPDPDPGDIREFLLNNSGDQMKSPGVSREGYFSLIKVHKILLQDLGRGTARVVRAQSIHIEAISLTISG